MTPNELTQAFNLAKALRLISSSRIINGVLHVYTPDGRGVSWDAFTANYPLERLQAMVNRGQA